MTKLGITPGVHGESTEEKVDKDDLATIKVDPKVFTILQPANAAPPPPMAYPVRRYEGCCKMLMFVTLVVGFSMVALLLAHQYYVSQTTLTNYQIEALNRQAQRNTNLDMNKVNSVPIAARLRENLRTGEVKETQNQNIIDGSVVRPNARPRHPYEIEGPPMEAWNRGNQYQQWMNQRTMQFVQEQRMMRMRRIQQAMYEQQMIREQMAREFWRQQHMAQRQMAQARMAQANWQAARAEHMRMQRQRMEQARMFQMRMEQAEQWRAQMENRRQEQAPQNNQWQESGRGQENEAPQMVQWQQQQQRQQQAMRNEQLRREQQQQMNQWQQHQQWVRSQHQQQLNQMVAEQQQQQQPQEQQPEQQMQQQQQQWNQQPQPEMQQWPQPRVMVIRAFGHIIPNGDNVIPVRPHDASPEQIVNRLTEEPQPALQDRIYQHLQKKSQGMEFNAPSRPIWTAITPTPETPAANYDQDAVFQENLKKALAQEAQMTSPATPIINQGASSEQQPTSGEQKDDSSEDVFGDIFTALADAANAAERTTQAPMTENQSEEMSEQQPQADEASTENEFVPFRSEEQIQSVPEEEQPESEEQHSVEGSSQEEPSVSSLTDDPSTVPVMIEDSFPRIEERTTTSETPIVVDESLEKDPLAAFLTYFEQEARKMAGLNAERPVVVDREAVNAPREIPTAEEEAVQPEGIAQVDEAEPHFQPMIPHNPILI